MDEGRTAFGCRVAALQALVVRVTLLGFGLAGVIGAQATTSVRVFDSRPGSSLTIRGSTSVSAKWHCSATNISARVAVAPRADGATAALPDVRGVMIQVPVADLRCQSAAMERAMRKALNADRDTAALVISGSFEIPDDVSPSAAGERHLVGALRVAGMERNVSLRAKIEYQADSSMRVRSTVPLALTSFGIVPPRVLFGIVRARDAIVVEVDLSYPNPRSALIARSGSALESRVGSDSILSSVRAWLR